MKSSEIRQRFLDFFEREGHSVVPSASLIAPDPTLLLVNAGMVPFKPFFLGETKPPYPRAVSVQKCVRTLDIDEVGKTTRHASFFQMCGNFSFGDYFKAGAIDFAWRLLTDDVSKGGFGFDPERLWVTVFHDDDESADIWHNQIGVPIERIQRRGMADNFWSMGVPGPCGPCSEIYFDRGAEYGKPGGPIADESRYLEVWNLVFMQFERGAGGGKDDFPILGELPAKNIDTGMGLERMAAILQGVENIYEIDTTRMILDCAAELTQTRYGLSEEDDVRLRVVADHARTCAFLLNDGVIPGNEGRGYVLRRMMRRVIRSMRLLGQEDACIAKLINISIDSMQDQYPELDLNRDRIVASAVGEEVSFLQTLKSGNARFESAVAEMKSTKSRVLSADRVFEMHDTYGFPFDLTLEMASERGLSVDADGFRRLMNEQRERAKSDAKNRKAKLADLSVYRAAAEEVGSTNFIGYKLNKTETTLGALVVNGGVAKAALQGDSVEVVLKSTPFYAEGGGQLGDSGRIVSSSGAIIEVDDVQQPISGLYVHSGRVIDGEFISGEEVLAEIDLARRLAISRAHTATHMIHKAFREKLGESATQMGSENAPGRLRFDFPSPQAVPKSMLVEVEHRVNELLIENLPVTEAYMTQSEAQQIGAMALFGEKYGDEVRVISIGEWAKELCGGTHTEFSGQLGIVTFLSESSIGAGIRRVEALVGSDAHSFLAKEHLILNQLTELLKVRVDDLPERIDTLLTKLRDAERAIEQQKRTELLANASKIVGAGKSVKDYQLFFFAADLDVESLRELVARTKGDHPKSIVIGATKTDPAALIIGVGDSGINSEIDAKKILTAVTTKFGGKGGGRPEMTQGSLAAGISIDSVMHALFDLVSELI